MYVSVTSGWFFVSHQTLFLLHKHSRISWKWFFYVTHCVLHRSWSQMFQTTSVVWTQFVVGTVGFFFEAEAISFCVWQCNLGNRSAQSQQLGMVTNRILHEYLLNKSYEFMGLRQDSSLWFLALALWFFLLGIAECRAFSATGMGLKSSLTMVALCWAQLLREGREAPEGCSNLQDNTTPDAVFILGKFLRFTETEPRVKLHWKACAAIFSADVEFNWTQRTLQKKKKKLKQDRSPKICITTSWQMGSGCAQNAKM